MSSKVKAIIAILTLAVVIHNTRACGTNGAPCPEGQVDLLVSVKSVEPTLPPIPEFCQTGRPEAAVDCACLLLIKDRVRILFKPIFLDVCEQFIGREAILKFGPRGCRRFGIKLNRRLRLLKVLKLFWFVNKLLPVCVPVKVPILLLVGIKH